MRIKEIWKPVPGYEGLYEASTYGRIKSFQRNKTAVLVPCFDQAGYVLYELFLNRIGTVRRGHSLIAETFLGPRPPGKNVCHYDGKRANNKLNNLGYVTQKENISHQIAHGTLLLGEDTNNAKLTEKQVLRIRSLQGAETAIKIAEKFSISSSTVYSIFKRQTWKHLP